MDHKRNHKNGAGKAPLTRKTAQGRQKGSAPAAKKKNNGNPSAMGDVLVGTVECSPKGFGFLVIPGVSEDAFIAAHRMNGASHGDTVEATLISHNRGGGEAEVVRVLNRRHPRVVGTFYAEKDHGILVPDEIRIAREIYIPNGQTGNARRLDKAVCEPDYENRRHSLSGKIVEVLGQTGGKGVDILSIIRSYSLYEHFPAHVLKEAERVAVPVPKEEIARRKDFREDLIFTIDGDDSKDFDDAVSVTETPDGNFILGVHIADVAHYVTAGSALDKEALKRGTSVYFCDRVLPMLPPIISNDICSLNENEDRLTLSVVMEIDRAGAVLSHTLCEGVIRSRARMTYSKTAEILDGDPQLSADYAFLVPALKSMERLAKILFTKRKNRGNIEFDLPESEIVLDEKGRAVDIVKRARLVSHRMIEEFMLAANETVAQRFAKIKNAPFVYRVHEDPPAEKLESLTDFLRALGLRFPGNPEKPSPRDYNALLQAVSGGVYETAVGRVALRSMSKACYLPENKGHFGLAAEFYCHFTSPIRRYPDLAIHRIIKDYLNNGEACFKKYKAFAADASTQSSERERLAEKAERDVDDLKKAEYMSDKIGNRYPGLVSGVTEWGVFVELANTVEGMVRAENLPGDGYEYDRRAMRLSNGIHSYRIGDPLQIEVVAVNGLKVEFRLADLK